MKTAWLVLLAACGGAPAKPVDNVVATPKYSCETTAQATVAAHPALTTDQHRSVAHELEVACRDEHWPEAYVTCRSEGAPTCADTRSDEHKRHEHRIIARVTLLPGCLDYIRGMERLARCDKMPAASRDAMQQGIDAMLDGANVETLDASAKAALDSACRQGADAITQGLTSAGCP